MCHFLPRSNDYGVLVEEYMIILKDFAKNGNFINYSVRLAQEKLRPAVFLSTNLFFSSGYLGVNKLVIEEKS